MLESSITNVTEIVDRNLLVPYLDSCVSIFATAAQLYCRFREKSDALSLLDLAIPLVNLASIVHNWDYSNEEWEDLEDEVRIDFQGAPDTITRITKEVLETLDYDLRFTTVVDHWRLEGKNPEELRDLIMEDETLLCML